MPKNDLSRHDLLKNASLAGAAAAAGSFASTEASAAQAVPTRWDREADVVVIGSGACGMPAAIVAREAGFSLLMIDAQADNRGHTICRGAHNPLGGGAHLPKKGRGEKKPDPLFPRFYHRSP